MLTAKKRRVACVTASGGVTCNSSFRQRLAGACAKSDLKLRLAERPLCTDNAGMIGILAERKLAMRVETTPLDGDILVNWGL